MKKLILLILSAFLFIACTNQLAEESPAVEQPTAVEQPGTVEQPAKIEEPATKTSEVPQAVADSGDPETPEVILAKCLTEKGVKLYTASWCGHCKAQKELFGDALQYLDNTECAEDGAWAQACTDAGIEAVPTWIFADGTKTTGAKQLPDLAKLTGCMY